LILTPHVVAILGVAPSTFVGTRVSQALELTTRGVLHHSRSTYFFVFFLGVCGLVLGKLIRIQSLRGIQMVLVELDRDGAALLVSSLSAFLDMLTWAQTLFVVNYQLKWLRLAEAGQFIMSDVFVEKELRVLDLVESLNNHIFVEGPSSDKLRLRRAWRLLVSIFFLFGHDRRRPS
jgi:hypothetical protein